VRLRNEKRRRKAKRGSGNEKRKSNKSEAGKCEAMSLLEKMKAQSTGKQRLELIVAMNL